MNTFYLDDNLEICAQYHHNAHCVKLILEGTQLASNAVWSVGKIGPYKKTHWNHPLSIWGRTSYDNFQWICRYSLSLCAEYTYRYGKIHKCEQHLQNIISQDMNLPKLGITPRPLCMPEQYKLSDPIESYRAYYIGEKILNQNVRIDWKNRPIPEWIPLEIRRNWAYTTVEGSL
jgi:hypothetical protein